MAQETIVQFVDDLDGTTSEDISTVTFALDGVEYEIDLTEANAQNLRDSLQEFIASARRTGGRFKRGTAAAHRRPATPAVSTEQTKAIRHWARQNGYTLSDRGRVPEVIVDAFDRAHATNGRKRKTGQPAFSG
jgi:hypothetical protein